MLLLLFFLVCFSIVCFANYEIRLTSYSGMTTVRCGSVKRSVKCLWLCIGTVLLLTLVL